MFKNITSLLDKFSKLSPPHKFIKNIFIEILKEKLNILVAEKEIDIQKDILYIKTNSIVKSEIFLHKRELLETLSSKLSSHKKIISDIR